MADSESPPVKARVKPNWKKGSPSCKECVRLKFKCSREPWPCNTCVRRGCEKICPNGTLSRRPPNAQVRIQELQLEIQELKVKLAEATMSGSQASSSLAQDSFHSVKSLPSNASSSTNAPPGLALDFQQHTRPQQEGPSEQLDDIHLDAVSGSGHGIMDEHGSPRYLGRSAGALYVCEEEQQSPPTVPLSLPFLTADHASLVGLQELFPTPDHAFELLSAYDELVGWMYCPLDAEAVRAALETIYNGEHEPHLLRSRLLQVAPHRLATVLMMFALGLLFGTDSVETRPYLNAATALLTLPDQHFMVHHSLAAVETLHMMVTYLFGIGNSDSAKAAWPLLGLAVRTACAMGLHRDASKWGLGPAQLNNRSRIWWECATYDILQSLNFGRPYATPTQLCDCPPPFIAGDDPDAVWHGYKYRLAHTFFLVADCLASAELPDYSVVMALDKELREVEQSAPSWLRWNEAALNDPSARSSHTPRQITQQHAAVLFCHKALLALHRPWFFKSVMAGTEPLLGPHAPSFTASVNSARKHTRLMASLLRHNPNAAHKWWFFIFHAYTAAVIQYTVLRRVPTCMVADDVRSDFQSSYDIIAKLAPNSPSGHRALPMLTRLHERLAHPSPSPASVVTHNDIDAALLASFFPATGGETWDNGIDMASFASEPKPDFDPTQVSLDPMQMSEMDPLLQTLLYWNVAANQDQQQV